MSKADELTEEVERLIREVDYVRGVAQKYIDKLRDEEQAYRELERLTLNLIRVLEQEHQSMCPANTCTCDLAEGVRLSSERVMKAIRQRAESYV